MRTRSVKTARRKGLLLRPHPPRVAIPTFEHLAAVEPLVERRRYVVGRCRLTGEETMRKLILSSAAVVALAVASVAINSPSQAAAVAPNGLRAAADELAVIDTVQFTWRGRPYCWYPTGWRGPGWYRCGFRWRRGFGWGGPLGWHGWRRPGPAFRPGRPGRPGFNRPEGSRPGASRPGGGGNRPGGGGGGGGNRPGGGSST